MGAAGGCLGGWVSQPLARQMPSTHMPGSRRRAASKAAHATSARCAVPAVLIGALVVAVVCHKLRTGRFYRPSGAEAAALGRRSAPLEEGVVAEVTLAQASFLAASLSSVKPGVRQSSASALLSRCACSCRGGLAGRGGSSTARLLRRATEAARRPRRRGSLALAQELGALVMRPASASCPPLQGQRRAAGLLPADDPDGLALGQPRVPSRFAMRARHSAPPAALLAAAAGPAGRPAAQGGSLAGSPRAEPELQGPAAQAQQPLLKLRARSVLQHPPGALLAPDSPGGPLQGGAAAQAPPNPGRQQGDSAAGGGGDDAAAAPGASLSSSTVPSAHLSLSVMVSRACAHLAVACSWRAVAAKHC